MKIIKTMLLLMLFCFSAFSAEKEDAIEKQNQYKEFNLSPGKVYIIYVKKDTGVTTVTFPSGIGKIAGYNICLASSRSMDADFQISTKAGSYFFTLVALTAKSNATINITYNRKTYILYLKHSTEKAYAAVNFNFNDQSSTHNAARRPSVSSSRLLSLIDQTKVYNALKNKYPGIMQQTLRCQKKDTFKYGKFNIILSDVVRYNNEDTLIFKVLLENLTNKTIKYDKYSFSAQLKNKTYFMSVADASGFMPPKSKTWAFFGITSTPTGGRNNLSPNNNFLIGLTTDYMQKQLNIATGSRSLSPNSSPEKKVLRGPVATFSSKKVKSPKQTGKIVLEKKIRGEVKK